MATEQSDLPPVIGIVGGIGSGKSEVSRALEKAGGVVVSGDAIGHQALRQPTIRDRVVEKWGRSLLDEEGEVSRKRLAEIVFQSEDDREALEAIVHPWIKNRIKEELQSHAESGAKFLVLDAAILLESGWNDVCNKLIFVDVPRSVRLQRIGEQRGWTEKEVSQRESAQWSLAEKKKRADRILDNSGTREDLERQINELLKDWGLSPVGS